MDWRVDREYIENRLENILENERSEVPLDLAPIYEPSRPPSPLLIYYKIYNIIYI